MRFFWILLSLGLLTSCERPFFFERGENPNRPEPVLPSKDEVARINGRALGISAFLYLKKQVPKATTESLLWISLGAMALQDHLYQSGIAATDEHAIRIARYGIGELPLEKVRDDLRMAFPVNKDLPSVTQVRDQIDALLSRSEILRNTTVLNEFRDRQ